ncbi:MAG: glycosyltransferase [Isosphaeraceae bacterium]
MSDPEVADGPFWSVLFPTYLRNSYDCDLFERSLRSVLDQDPGRDQMEIVIVDNCSPDDLCERLVQRLAPERVVYHRNPTNLGLVGNFNACLSKARGRWVHLMHHDDLLLPGFYDHLARADREAPGAGAAFCQHAFITASGRWAAISRLERESPGLLDDWLAQISGRQAIQFASIVVRREVYETLGGFRTDLCFVLDWEMWVRIASRYPVWFEPTVLACYRVHAENETSRLRKARETGLDVERAIAIVRSYLPERYHEGLGWELRRDSPADKEPSLRAIARELLPPALLRVVRSARRGGGELPAPSDLRGAAAREDG